MRLVGLAEWSILNKICLWTSANCNEQIEIMFLKSGSHAILINFMVKNGEHRAFWILILGTSAHYVVTLRGRLSYLIDPIVISSSSSDNVVT